MNKNEAAAYLKVWTRRIVQKGIVHIKEGTPLNEAIKQITDARMTVVVIHDPAVAEFISSVAEPLCGKGAEGAPDNLIEELAFVNSNTKLTERIDDSKMVGLPGTAWCRGLLAFAHSDNGEPLAIRRMIMSPEWEISVDYSVPMSVISKVLQSMGGSSLPPGEMIAVTKDGDVVDGPKLNKDGSLPGLNSPDDILEYMAKQGSGTAGPNPEISGDKSGIVPKPSRRFDPGLLGSN